MKQCIICHKEHKRSGKVCPVCAERVEGEARAWQERDYLARWLSTRDDDQTPSARRLREMALSQDVDWFDPPAPMSFAERLATLTDSYARQAA